MSFRRVDASSDADALVRYLNAAAENLVELKASVSERLALSNGARVLELGCGAGHDVEYLRARGCLVIGLETSRTMLAASATRLGSPEGLVQASGAGLPFREDSLDAVRIERVLQHVAAPATVLAEVRRVVRGGGGVAVLEPDWSTLSLHSRFVDVSQAIRETICAGSRQPVIGRELRGLLVEVGFDDVSVEIDTPAWTDFATVNRILQLPRLVERAQRMGLVTAAEIAAWLRDLHELSASGGFFASVNRVIAWRPIGQ